MDSVFEDSGVDAARQSDSPTVDCVKSGDGHETLFCSGVWTTRTADLADKQFAAFERARGDRLALDLKGVTSLDTAGAWLVTRFVDRMQADGVDISVSNVSPGHRVLVDVVADAVHIEQPASMAKGKANPVYRFVETIGRLVYSVRRDATMGLHILGASIAGVQMKEGSPSRVAWAPIASQIDRMGVRAIPIVALMSFIIGAIIAQQGAFQLRYFGAEIFVVDLVSILVLREIGVLITAIMIAGRSGSAITAEIGSMRMREEVDALTVIGLNPVAVLVLPRIIALVIALPLLSFLANIAALAGAVIVADVYSGISLSSFVTRLNAAVEVTDLLSGLFKAPFMAIIIGVIASVEGLKVGGSAESLGRHVTASVVKAIFLVIVIDGIFAIFFAAIDV